MESDMLRGPSRHARAADSKPVAFNGRTTWKGFGSRFPEIAGTTSSPIIPGFFRRVSILGCGSTSFLRIFIKSVHGGLSNQRLVLHTSGHERGSSEGQRN